MTRDVAVVVTARDAASTLPRVLAAAGALRAARVALHDDGSDDDSAALAARGGAEVVRLPHSGGPSRGRNLALDDVRQRYVLLLDGDAAPRPDALAELLATAERTDATVVLPRVLLEDGSLQHGPARMSWLALSRFHGWWGRTAPSGETVGWSAGGATALLIDRSLLPAATRFDESFSLRPTGTLARALAPRGVRPRPELEDADFLLRVALGGGRVAFAPRAEVFHLNPGLARHREGREPYPIGKLGLQSRNRRRIALKCFSASTLLLSAPLQLLAEVLHAWRAVRAGAWDVYAAGWSETLEWLPDTLRERRRIQSARREHDRALLTALPPSRRASRGASALAFFALLVCCGCKPDKPFEAPVIAQYEEVLRRPPDAVRGGIKLWGVAPGSALRMFYAEVAQASPLGINASGPTALLVLEGELGLRVKMDDYVLGPGSYAFIPQNDSFRLRRVGRRRLVLAGFHAAFESWQWQNLQVPLTPVK